jgi:hypothetical protein
LTVDQEQLELGPDRGLPFTEARTLQHALQRDDFVAQALSEALVIGVREQIVIDFYAQVFTRLPACRKQRVTSLGGPGARAMSLASSAMEVKVGTVVQACAGSRARGFESSTPGASAALGENRSTGTNLLRLFAS